MRKGAATNIPSKGSNWVSLANTQPTQHNQQPGCLRSDQPTERYNCNQQPESTTLTHDSSMLLSKRSKNCHKPRFTDLQQFQKENFPTHNTGDTSITLQFETIIKQKQNQEEGDQCETQLEQLAKIIRNSKKQSFEFLMKSDTIYGKHLEIINEYYKQLHMMLDVEKNKHCNAILIMKRNIQSKMKIKSQLAEIHLDQIASLIEMKRTSSISTLQKSMEKFKDFVSSNQHQGFEIYQFQLKSIETIKNKFQSIISIQPTPTLPPRRQKSHSMGPLKVLSLNNTIVRHSRTNSNQLVIQEQGDLSYTDCENQMEESSDVSY